MGGMQMVSVEELIRALRDYSAGRIDEQEAHQLAERALAEAETAMDIWLFDHVRTVAKGYATNQGGFAMPQNKKLDSDGRLAACTVSAATGRARCWCGRDAVVSRVGADVVTHYCSEHWLVWWESALLDAVLTVSTAI